MISAYGKVEKKVGDRIYDLVKALIKGGYKRPTERIWNKYYAKYKPWFPYRFSDFR